MINYKKKSTLTLTGLLLLFAAIGLVWVAFFLAVVFLFGALQMLQG